MFCLVRYPALASTHPLKLTGTRKYLPAMTVINKIDGVSMETIDELARTGDGNNVMISCETDLGIDWLLDRIWQELALVK